MGRSAIVSVRLSDEDFILFKALAKYRGCAMSTLLKNCALEFIDRELDVQNWIEAYSNYEENGEKCSLYDLKEQGVI